MEKANPQSRRNKILKWLLRIAFWFFLLCVIYLANYFYFSWLEFSSQPNLLAIASFNFIFAIVIYVSARKASLIGGFVGLALLYLAVNTSIASEARWQRKKSLFYNYVIDFSYDKYCPLSIEDKYIIEEISIYGIMDCGDAKIPYKE